MIFSLFTNVNEYAILIIEGGKMIIGMSFIASAFIFASMIAIIYFAKKHVDTIETKLYNYILIISIINMIIEFTLCTNILLDVPLFSFYNLLINKNLKCRKEFRKIKKDYLNIINKIEG